MVRNSFPHRLSVICVFLASVLCQAQSFEHSEWKATAEAIYDAGFVQRLAKQGGAVGLFQHDLIQNDAPGAGRSEKGSFTGTIWGANHARKVFVIDDPRAAHAEVYVFAFERDLKHPLTVVVNGMRTQLPATPRKGWETVRWVAFPPEWLKRGENIIELSCPEARKEEEGWKLFVARADEYKEGGGDPAGVGETSSKSSDHGKTWQRGCGTDPQGRAEWCVRLGLTRHLPSGSLETPVIDLWRGNDEEFVARQRTIRNLSIAIKASAPPGTALVYHIRKGIHPSLRSPGWEPYERIGEGPDLEAAIDGERFNRRYLQLKIELTTTNPLLTPLVRSVDVKADFKEDFPIPRHENIRVIELDNPPIRYSSVAWEWEATDRPELARLRRQENLDEVVSGARTQYEAQMRLLDYAKKRWEWTNPAPEYPEWNALAIVDRVNKGGGGGMCIQQNLFFIGLCQAFGWQGRLVGVDGHEVAEVWSDDYGKWVYFDAFFPNHCLCDPKTGEPLSMLELHERYLEYFYPDRSMDWATDYRLSADEIHRRPDKPRVLRSSLTYHDQAENEYVGFINARILRILPRTNFFAKVHPRPVAHDGGGYYWDGYVSWYDARTPIRGQYARYTDRPRDLWPDLNTVHVTATQGYGSDRLFLEFETYTPNFKRLEVSVDGGQWKPVEDRWTWLLVPGKNALLVRAVNTAESAGKSARIIVNRVVVPLHEWRD